MTNEDRYGLISDPDGVLLLDRLAEALALPAPEGGRWRAATIVMYSLGEHDRLIAAQLQHLHDLDLPVSERSLLNLALGVIDKHLRGWDG